MAFGQSYITLDSVLFEGSIIKSDGPGSEESVAICPQAGSDPFLWNKKKFPSVMPVFLLPYSR